MSEKIEMSSLGESDMKEESSSLSHMDNSIDHFLNMGKKKKQKKIDDDYLEHAELGNSCYPCPCSLCRVFVSKIPEK